MLNRDIYQELRKYLSLQDYYQLIITSKYTYRLFDSIFIYYRDSINISRLIFFDKLDIIISLCDTIPKEISKYIYYTIIYNRPAIFRYICSTLNILYIHNAIQISIYNDCLEIMKMIYDNNIRYGSDKNEMNTAIKYNRLHMVEYLHQVQNKQYTRRGMYIAIKCDYIDIVKYLYTYAEGNKYPIPNNIIEILLRLKYFDMLQYLCKHNTKISLQFMFNTAISYGELYIIKWLCENNIISYDSKMFDDAIVSAESENRDNIVSYLSSFIIKNS